MLSSVYILLSITNAIMYNIFFNYLSSVVYSDLPFQERQDRTIVTLFFAGIAGILIAAYIVKKNSENDDHNSITSTGLKLGGLLLILTALIGSWDSINNDFKVCLAALGLTATMWMAYNMDMTDTNKK